MTQIASLVNQEATAPTAASDEWNLWLAYINRGVSEWAAANDWEELRKNFSPSVAGSSLASVALPLDFRKFAGPVKLYNGLLEQGVEYPEVLSEEFGLYNTDDNYLSLTGNTALGFNMVLNPATLGSGASLLIQYFSMPTSLASPAEFPPVPDPQFLVDRTIAYIFEARSDSRFQLEEQKARERLLSMVESHEMRKFNSYSNPNPVISTERKVGFRIGRD